MARPAAFIRVEGTLIAPSSQRAAAWLATRSQRLSYRLPRLAAIALAAPVAIGLSDASMKSRVTWMGLRGTSRDRLRVLGEEYWQTKLAGNIVARGEALISRAKKDGFLVVLISDHPSCIISPLREAVSAAALTCNEIEFSNNRATGRLKDPVIARFGGAALKALADELDVDLARSRAYGSTTEDQMLLCSVGHPCAVYPDRTLRNMAKDMDWPIVEAL